MLQGDITEQDVDAIVNAANPSLMGGGGVDGAIHRRGGAAILEECRTIRRENWPDGLPSGKAVITTGGHLRARHVIHTVGPIWKGGSRGEAEDLADCYTNSLQIAKGKRLRSLAFPAISTGIYGYPIHEAAIVALKTVKGFVEREEWPPSVNFVLFNLPSLQAYEKAAAESPLV
jgi:O-acetyl-ADP-ribose deacetylase (regulator of RNase III)